jgi:hypothetical protein
MLHQKWHEMHLCELLGFLVPTKRGEMLPEKYIDMDDSLRGIEKGPRTVAPTPRTTEGNG